MSHRVLAATFLSTRRYFDAVHLSAGASCAPATPPRATTARSPAIVLIIGRDPSTGVVRAVKLKNPDGFISAALSRYHVGEAPPAHRHREPRLAGGSVGVRRSEPVPRPKSQAETPRTRGV